MMPRTLLLAAVISMFVQSARAQDSSEIYKGILMIFATLPARRYDLVPEGCKHDRRTEIELADTWK